MQEQQLFEYAVIRVVPQVEREEFLNVGVVLFCARKKFLQVLYVLDHGRLSAFSPRLDIAEVAAYLRSFEKICNGSPDSGPIGCLPPPDRFRWLTATRSTVLQASKIHPGFCIEPAEQLMKLFKSIVEL